jgi:hypothetical protein
MKQDNDARIVLGIPTRGQMMSHTTRTLVDMTIWDAMHGGKRLHHQRPCIWIIGASLIVNSRNTLVKRFLDLPEAPEWLLMLDDDQLYPPHLLEVLLASVEFVEKQTGQRCLTMSVPVWRLHGDDAVRSLHNVFALAEDGVSFVEHQGLPENAVVQVAAIGAGCLMIHRDALLALREHSASLGFGDTECWFRHVAWPRNEGEDVYFCRLLLSAGIPLYATTSVGTLEHVKMLRIDREHPVGVLTI